MFSASADYRDGYLDRDLARAIEGAIDAAPWLDTLKRRVQHYGYRYDYKARRITPDSYLGPLPEWLEQLAGRLVADGIFATQPDQVIINEYLPGQGIAPHVDCEPCFGDVIASLSLGSGCVMNFAHVATGKTMARYLEPRSLLVLQGASRFEWTHGIAARKTDVVDGISVPRGRRVSLTFRTVISSS